MVRRYIITQGEYCVAADPDVTISTLLGSCVACCLWDPKVPVGGMNHILLASTTRHDLRNNWAGVNAMELLINSLLKLGARRDRLQAKIFGGAQMIEGLSNIGPANVVFVRQFLEQESIACISQSVGGELARQVVFTPTTGAARVKIQHRPVYEPALPMVQPAQNGLELF